MTSPKNITLPRDSEFFIAIISQGLHCSIVLGANTKEGATVFLRSGKGVDAVAQTFSGKLCELWHFLTSSVKTKMLHESYFNEEHERDIRYSAHAITYTQLEKTLQYISNIGASQNEPDKFQCYQIENEQDGNVVLKYGPVANPDSRLLDEDPTAKNTLFFNYKNTCRHTAIDLLDKTHHTVADQAHLSKQFYSALPLATSFRYGKPDPTRPFLILPAPPNAYDASRTKILSPLYKQLNSLLKDASKQEKTKVKFDKLKELYIECAQRPKEIPIIGLLAFIDKWREDNNQYMGLTRKRYFFDRLISRQSRTQKILSSLPQKLDKT